MNLDINPNIEEIQYDLVLCKLNEEPLQELYNIEDFEIKKYHVNVDEISFTVPFNITKDNGEQVKNTLYDLVDGSMLVKMNDMKYFVLTKPEIKANEETGEIYKSIIGFSREYEFGQKLLIGYEADSRLLYDPTNQKDENGLEVGILNHIFSNSSWSIGYINADLMTKYRGLSFSKSTYLSVLNELQKTYDCIFQYDTINKVINVYKPEQIGVDSGLLISDYNFIKDLTQTINHDEIKTRLFLRGKDNLSIQSINVTGQPYIENFSFYMTTKYMTQGLIDALNNYNNFVQTKQGQFEGYLVQLGDENSGLNKDLLTRQIELTALETELKIIQSNIDIAIADNKPLTTLKQQETAKLNEISAKKGQITSVQNQINSVYSNIQSLRNSLDKSNHFTEQQLKELDVFVREDEFSDSNYTEDNLEELFESGKEALQKVSYPALQFDVEVEDFLSLIGNKIKSRLALGDIVTLEHEELGFDIQVRLIGYTHNPDDNKLKLIFSNRDSVDDANIYLKDLLDSLTTSSGTVDYNKFKWDKGEDVSHSFTKYINNALDLAKQEIVRAEGQRPIFDERGLWLYKENPDGSINPEQIRAVNNVIALTPDNWNSVSTAITPKGVVAETIFGKLGMFATVQANQITVSEDGTTLPDEVLGDNVLQQTKTYNGVTITTADGVRAIANNNRTRTTLNATDGISIETRPSTSSAWVKKFYVDTNGKIQANDIEIGNSGLFKGAITIGTGNNVFKADNNGIYLGNANFNSAPFRVSMDGTLNATKGNFTGVVDVSDIKIDGESILRWRDSRRKIVGNYLADINANTITTGSIDADIINVYNLNADNISTGYLSANRIQGGTIQGVKISVDDDVGIGNWLYIGGGTSFYGYKGIEIEHGNQSAQISVSSSGLFEMESWGDIELWTSETLKLTGWDIVLSSASGSYLDSTEDYNEIATMYEIDEIWEEISAIWSEL